MKNLKFIFLIYTLSAMCLSLSAQKKPDFAYPKQVEASAAIDYQRCLKANNAHAALNALIRSVVASSLIDPATLPASIAKVDSAAQAFADSDIAGLYYSLLANLYDKQYNTQRWKYDNRNLPLTPMPTDITEWSGEQYKQKILEYSALSYGRPEVLSKLSIKDYLDIIDAPGTTPLFYPTLLDFVCSQASNVSYSKEQCGVAIGVAFDWAKRNESVPAQILWSSMQSKSSADVYDSLLDAYRVYCDTPCSALLLNDLYSNMPWTDGAFEPYYVEEVIDADHAPDSTINVMARRKFIVDEINAYVERFPESQFKLNLLNIKKQILRKDASVEFPNLIAINEPFDVAVDFSNATKLAIAIYLIPDDIVKSQKSIKSYIRAHRPVLTRDLSVERALPFADRQTISISVGEYGYYAIVPMIDGKCSIENAYVNVGRCLPAFPILFSSNKNPQIAMIDPYSGRPLKDVDITYNMKVDGSRRSFTATTDKIGLADIADACRSYHNARNDCNVFVKVNGKSYNYFDQRMIQNLYDRAGNLNCVTKADVYTDRSIYHLGDTVRVLAIVYKNNVGKRGKQQLAVGESVKIALYDVNDKIVGEKELKTDDFGRAFTDFATPLDGLTGNFYLKVSADGKIINNWDRIMVSDYKLPDFEVKVTGVEMDTPSPGCVTVNGVASYYSGVPLTSANIDVTLSSSSLWRWRYAQSDIYSASLSTDEAGRFMAVFSDSVFAKSDNGEMRFYNANFKATSPSGSSASASAQFCLGKKYVISLSVDRRNVDANVPFKPVVEVIDGKGEPAELPLHWALKSKGKVVAEGDFSGSVDFSSVTPGNYDFELSPVDSALADVASANLTIYNVSTDIVPTVSPLWVRDSDITAAPGQKVKILVGTPSDKAYVYLAYAGIDDKSVISFKEISKGYAYLEFECPSEFESIPLAMTALRDCQLVQITVNITKDVNKGLQIVGESFRDKLIPGSEEMWTFKIVDADNRPVEAALALDMYNKALDALAPHPFGDGRFRIDNEATHVYVDGANKYSLSNSCSPSIDLLKTISSFPVFPSFNFYGQAIGFGSVRKLSYSRALGASQKQMSMSNDAVMYDMAMPEEAVVADVDAVSGAVESEQEQDDAEQSDDFAYRDAEVPLAIWDPCLATDAEGNLCYSFRVPNANTTWVLKAAAWDRQMQFGSLIREFVAAKPIMAVPNVPRFMRAGDTAEISVSVLNNTDSVCHANLHIEFFDPLTGALLGKAQFADSVPAHGTAAFFAPVLAAASQSAIGYRVKASTSTFSDGEQGAFPVLPSEASLVETVPFYLNPGQTDFEMKLPSDRNARISLTFCENPAWTIVTALPGLRQDFGYANSAAAALFSAAIASGIINDNPSIKSALDAWLQNPSDSALVSMLEKNEDLKIAVLNSTPWVQAAQSDSERMANLAMIFDSKPTAEAIDKAIDSLKKLQRGDGGWAWGDWCQRSSVWVTSNVLAMLGDLKAYGWQPESSTLDEMIKKALKYYDSNVENTDLAYCLIRPRFKDVPMSQNGEVVVKLTVNDIIKNWKKYTSPSYKATAAEALYLNGYQAKAKELLGSVSEFGVWTKSQGLTFPSVNSLSDYAALLDAYNVVDPSSKNVDGLRQQLIVRKQATDWGSAVVTSQVVAAILNSGSRWTVDAQGAKVSVGNVEILPSNGVEEATGCIRADLSAYAGKKLRIATSGVGPSYGAVYSQFKQAMSDVKPQWTDDLSIEKTMMVRRGTEWKYVDGDLKVGDLVKVQLSIHVKRNMQYVSIVDDRPAAFEPVAQLPGWLYSEGAAFYRENRDSSTTMHIEYLSPGTYLLNYEMYVAVAGDFSSGVASIQSQYAPELSAHSAAQILKVAK